MGSLEDRINQRLTVFIDDMIWHLGDLKNGIIEEENILDIIDEFGGMYIINDTIGDNPLNSTEIECVEKIRAINTIRRFIEKALEENIKLEEGIIDNLIKNIQGDAWVDRYIERLNEWDDE